VLGLTLKSEHDSPATSAKAAFFNFGDIDLELLEISDAELRERRMAGERRARIEHLGIRVPDVDAAAEELRAQGVRMSTERPFGAAGWRYYFTDPETTDGVIYQIFEAQAPL
jgi:catechol 2,3-dioxygenase-like lactoylglutathione lyase family enzyme